MDRLKAILVKGENLTFILNDGTEIPRHWEKPRRRGHKQSEKQKEKARQIMLERWTPERKKEMSEKMKQIRKERGDQWRKA